MRKIKLSIVVLFVTLMFTGCAKAVELTDKETSMFAEYISKGVLAYDKNYDQELISPEYDKDEEEEQTITTQSVTNVEKVSTTTSKNNQSKSATVNDVLGNSTISVSYKSAKVYENYPEKGSNYFEINSTEGTKLLVITFALENKTTKDRSYNMLTESVTYNLTMENGSQYNPLLTLLADDIQFVNKVIPANKTERGLLVFRISEKEIKLKGTLQIVNGKQSATLEIN